jgi:hypothetical protein
MGFIVKDKKCYWPNGIVPYELDAKLNTTELGIVLRAIGNWNRDTVIQLIPRGSHQAYVRFTSDVGFCGTPLGRQGNGQIISCDLSIGEANGNPMTHEIGHALGLLHEHKRPDAKEHVSVLHSNILTSKKPQFTVKRGELPVGPYDQASRMHYTEFAGAKDTTRPTIRVHN